MHIPVLLKEILSLVSPKDDGIYFDGTFGGGGYSKAILESSNCRIIAIDRDAYSKNIANEFNKDYGNRFIFAQEKFSRIKAVLQANGIEKVDGIVLDLGLSSFQLADSSRGFSFNLSGPIDMRMGLNDQTAMDVIRRYSVQDLANIIYEFGEERFSRRIAKNIKLNIDKISNTADLARIVRSCIRKRGKIDSATKTFQALRILVNDELGELQAILKNALDLLQPEGIIAIVSFHSLEDRIVKLFFKDLAVNSAFKLLTKKPVIPSKEEILLNPRSRSAKLRAISMLR
ncbi:MAG: 16S rRNA (cytosine(1402)-N(4))-methyltransferase RsmH [Holosporaceae bacterium]|jgi:16S rRNA (cytosine1402-N4)-methyltransferase|nr:16S rRNA (cytosine(1402)-N(4))-methyltransferase RsmH [Holosporaceae bacterium]